MALLARWARETPDKVAAHFPDIGIDVTFAALDARANRAAQWLMSLGLEPGDGIALLMDNRPEFLELAFACRRAGLYYTPLSVHLRPQEVAYMLGDADAKVRALAIPGPTSNPESSIKSSAKFTILTGSPISSMNTSPPFPSTAACSTSCTASGMVMK